MSNTIITIGRTFGSGAREIGRKVAEELGIPFFDKELLELAAKDGKISLESLRSLDEKKAGAFFQSMVLNPYTGDMIESVEMAAQNILSHTIQTIAKQGSCVIVGRHADKILRHDYDILSVFVSAPMEKRIARVSARDGLSDKDSKKKIYKADKSRRAFYNAYGEGDWGDAANYHLCIDSGDIGIANSAALIIQYLILRGKTV